MPTIIEVKDPNITLLRLVANNPNRFYNQDWYFDEEFANTPLPTGIYELEPLPDVSKVWKSPSAVLCAWAWTRWPGATMHMFYDYVWTSDRDGEGNIVYVGGLKHNKRDRLFQIHRHLDRPDVHTLNVVYS